MSSCRCRDIRRVDSNYGCRRRRRRRLVNVAVLTGYKAHVRGRRIHTESNPREFE